MTMHLVRVYRLKRGLTMKQLADMASITTRVVYKIEKDPTYNAKRDTMRSIASALNLPTSLLFFPEEEIDKRKLLSDMFMHTMAILHQQGLISTTGGLSPVGPSSAATKTTVVSGV